MRRDISGAKPLIKMKMSVRPRFATGLATSLMFIPGFMCARFTEPNQMPHRECLAKPIEPDATPS